MILYAVLPLYGPWKQIKKKVLTWNGSKSRKRLRIFFGVLNRFTWYSMGIDRKCSKTLLPKTNTICNELYYVDNFRIIKWFRNPATTKIKPFATLANKWKPLFSQNVLP